MGIISTGINGIKVLLGVSRCPYSKSDDICSVNFLSSFKDDKLLINDASLSILNQKSAMAKIIPQKMPDGSPGFAILYNYICKDLEDPKFLATVLASFGADIALIANTYTTGLGIPAAKP
jgi:hypothetical protein